jgi:hypothetical protein
MREIYIKKGPKGTDWIEFEVYTKDSTEKRDLSFRCMTIRFSVVNRLLSYQQVGPTEEGFLCASCKDQVFRGRASGHIEVVRGKGLCGMCASTEQTFNRYIGYDDKGAYAWKGGD